MRSVHNPVDRTPAQDALLRAVNEVVQREVGRFLGDEISDAWDESGVVGRVALGKVRDALPGLIARLDVGNVACGMPEFRTVLDELDRVIAEAEARGKVWAAKALRMVSGRELTEAEKEHGRTIVAELRREERADEGGVNEKRA